MKIITKPVVTLTKQELEQCYANSFGLGGMMMPEAKRALRENDVDVLALMLYAGSEFVGWALLTPVTTDECRFHHGTSWTKRRSKYTAQFYINRDYRGKGYAHTLMRHIINNYDARPHVLPHDKASGGFFSSYTVTVTNWDKPNMNYRKPRYEEART